MKGWRVKAIRVNATLAIALKFQKGKLVFALSPSFRGDVARPGSGIRVVVSPIALCELWPPAMAVRVSDHDKIVLLKRAVSMNCFMWKTSSKHWLEDADHVIFLLRLFDQNTTEFVKKVFPVAQYTHPFQKQRERADC